MNKHFIHICVMCGEDFENNIQASYKCPKCEEKLMLIKKLEMIDKAERKLTMISGRNRMRSKARNRINDMTILYVHGLSSSRQSGSVNLLRRYFLQAFTIVSDLSVKPYRSLEGVE